MDEEVRNLLVAWGLEEFVEVFKQNAISSLSFTLLNDTMIRDLIPPIGPRAIFTKNLEVHKNSMHTDPITINGDDFSIGDLLTFPLDENPSCSKTFTASTASEKIPISGCVPTESPFTNSLLEDSTNIDNTCDLRLLLQSTLEGKGLLNLDKSIPLSNAARSNLVRIIATFILRKNPEVPIRCPVYAYWARAITTVFPEEKPSVYFHTKIVESTRGVVTRLAGKLPDQIHNLKRKYRDTGVVEKRRRISRSSESSSPNVHLRLPDGIFEEEDSEEKLLWLKNSTEPWTAVEQKWVETVSSRLIASKELTISQYFNQYPALKKPKGYFLLQKDFEHLYEGQYKEITETLPTLKEKIFGLAKNRKSSKDKNLELLLTYEQGSEEASNLACLLLIPSLLAVTSIRLKTKKIWRPSKAESTASFILHVKNNSDIHTCITGREKKFGELGLTVQPFVIIIGSSIEDITTYFVVINDVFYCVPDILTAISVCFKIIWVINAQYPVESHSTWLFIQKAFFQFKTKFDSNSTSAITLLAELGIEN